MKRQSPLCVKRWSLLHVKGNCLCMWKGDCLSTWKGNYLCMWKGNHLRMQKGNCLCMWKGDHLCTWIGDHLCWSWGGADQQLTQRGSTVNFCMQRQLPLCMKRQLPLHKKFDCWSSVLIVGQPPGSTEVITFSHTEVINDQHRDNSQRSALWVYHDALWVILCPVPLHFR